MSHNTRYVYTDCSSVATDSSKYTQQCSVCSLNRKLNTLQKHCTEGNVSAGAKKRVSCWLLGKNVDQSQLTLSTSRRYIVLVEVQRNAEALVVATKEIGLEVNADKTKYMVMSRDRNAGRGHSVKVDNTSIERVEEFKYLGTTLTDQNSIQEEIKSRLKLGNACYHSVQNLLSSRLIFKNLKIKIYRTIILPVVLYGCETWSLTLREEYRLRVFENRVLRRVFGPTRDEVTREWTPYPILCGL